MKKRTPLFEDYSYQVVDTKTIMSVFEDKRSEVFGKDFTIELEQFYQQREKDFLKAIPRNKNIYRLYILVYFKNEIVGWHIGFQKFDSYYMMNTGIYTKHQGIGIYTKLLTEIIQIIHKKGFISITSSHLASNNKVLVPKLKAGFVITGMEIEERFGVLINLKYFFNEDIKNVYLMRTGSIKPN